MLKVKFWRIENVVLMKVLEQGDEIKRGCGKFYNDTSTKMDLYSNAGPSISEGSQSIYVRGIYNRFDNLICAKDFDSISEAIDYYHKAIKTIEDYNNCINKNHENYINNIEDIESYIVE